MEQYQGVKFRYRQTQSTFSYDHRLLALNQWAYLFSLLGLAPIHATGAYGNHSYKTGESAFIVTKSAMIPARLMQPEDFCHVVDWDEKTSTFITEGLFPPSSESFLHYSLYRTLPRINAVLHGHCLLLNTHAQDMNIPVTEKFHAYGTPELTQSALDLVTPATEFFILKDHGFVALGEDIDGAGKVALKYYGELIDLLRKKETDRFFS